MFILLNALWFIWELKYILFWLYLWQLKEYHVGRFIDHFRTYKGRRIVLNIIFVLKIILIALFFVGGELFPLLYSALFLVYLIQAIIFIASLARNTAKNPTKTLKTLFLGAVSFVVVILFLSWTIKLKNEIQPTLLLAFDIFTPLVISIIVLFFQPFFVAIRNNILRKAKGKMERIKLLSNQKVIVITGSYGKTSTKEFLTTILSEKYKVLSTKKHQNSEIGIAKCILEDLKPSHQIFIAEVGAYNKGKVKEVCGMLKPKIGIVTGVNEQHLALFGSLENLLSAEGGGELADCLPKNGTLVVNGENKYCLELLKKSSNLPESQEKIYARSNKIIDSDIWTEDVEVKKDSVSFVAVDKNKNLAHFDVKVLGKHNVQNLLGAILVANEIGMSFEEISEACKNIEQEQAGIVLKHGKHGIDIVDSSYSSNPDGVLADLDYLSVFPQKKVIVMPCLIELGPKSAEIHEKIGKKIGEVCGLAIIINKDKFESIKKGALAAGMKPKNILLCDNPKEIYSMVTLFCKSGDAVLLEGRVPSTLIKLLVE